MQLIKKLMAIGLILFLSGCATPRQQIEVKRTSGDFDYRTRIYKNYDHNLQLVIPNYWTILVGDLLHREPVVKEIESRGFETLFIGIKDTDKDTAVILVTGPWADSVENFVRHMDLNAPDPFTVGLTQKKIRVGEIPGIERSGQAIRSKGFSKGRVFVHKQFAYNFYIVSTSPINDRDAEVLENLSFKLEDKQSSPLEKKLQLPEKPQTTEPITPSSVINVVVTGTSANIRSGAGNEFPIITTVKQGDKLILLGEYGEWLNIRLENGQDGWINNRFVK
jgi:uncharacterized protein YgiM (DUF1202 family)